MSEPDRHDLQPLLDRLLSGDRAALNELFTRLRPYLHSLARRAMGPAAGADASDVVQSSLRRASENIDDFLDKGPTLPHLLAWVKKIVHNRAMDEYRRRARLPRPSTDLPEPPARPEGEDRDANALAVMRALARLPERQRQVVELHYFDRLRDSEISARLGGSVAAVRVLRCRALRKLRALMEADHASQ
jgi:RNA polymerase sigma-70 factor (ECF subfamily)